MPEPRIRITCVNWSYPSAPKAIAYIVNAHGELGHPIEFCSWSAAMSAADQIASRWRQRSAEKRVRDA